MPPENDGDPARGQETLRLALGMRGGVSLAVWIGGACAEIDELRRATRDGTGFWSDLLRASGYQRVVVDVMAGASAGGLNGVLFAGAIRHGYRMDQLLGIWREVASVDRLRRLGPPWLSFFDGDAQFLDVIRTRMDELVAEVPAEERAAGASAYIDLQLSATHLEPIERATTSPDDEPLRSRRSDARFHFKQDHTAAVPRADFEEGSFPELSIAARATASFPMAFEAAVVRSSRPCCFGMGSPTCIHGAQPNDELEVQATPEETEARLRLRDCRNVFSDRRGTARNDAGLHPDDFVVADGGIVDNIPLGKAIDAIRQAPADGPTRRVLVYLHPTGPGHEPPRKARVGDAEDRRRRGPQGVVQGLIAAKLQGESIDGDISRIEEHNRRVRMGHRLRVSLAEELATSTAEDLMARQADVYRIQRGGADAEEVLALLRDPLLALGEDPFPEHPLGDDHWRAPLLHWDSAERQDLQNDLHGLFTSRIVREDDAEPARLLLAGLSPLLRLIDLVIELVRDEEARGGAVSSTKRELYELRSVVAELDRLRRIGWIVAAADRQAGVDSRSWVSQTLRGLNALLRTDPSTAKLACGYDPDATPDDQAEARGALFGGITEALDARLSRLADVDDGGVDVRVEVLDALFHLLGRRFAAPAPLHAAVAEVRLSQAGGGEASVRVDVHPVEVLRHLLLEGDGSRPEKAELVKRFVQLEVLLHQEHLLGSPGSTEIQFERMSAAAPTVDARDYAQLAGASRSEVAEPTTEAEVQALELFRQHHLLPNAKLAGNELASFSAFLKEEWRVNDWAWGRMDAVPTLVDLLMGSGRDVEWRRDRQGAFAGLDRAAVDTVEASPTSSTRSVDEEEVRLGLIKRRQDEIFRETAALRTAGPNPKPLLPESKAKWQAGLEQLQHPGSSALVKSVGEVAAVVGFVAADALPRSVPRVGDLLGRLLRTVAAFLSKPSGRLPAALSITTDDVVDDAGRKSLWTWIKPTLLRAMTGLPLLALCVVIGGGAAAVFWALGDSVPALAIGLVVGAVVGLLPFLALIWFSGRTLSWKEDRPRSR